jgi:hypothetical protein
VQHRTRLPSAVNCVGDEPRRSCLPSRVMSQPNPRFRSSVSYTDSLPNARDTTVETTAAYDQWKCDGIIAGQFEDHYGSGERGVDAAVVAAILISA